MTDTLDPEDRALMTAWAEKMQAIASWIEWGLTVLATVAGLVVAAAVVMVRAGERAGGSAAANPLLDLGVPAAVVLGAGTLGYLAGLVLGSWFRFAGHTTRTSASLDARLAGSRP